MSRCQRILLTRILAGGRTGRHGSRKKSVEKEDEVAVAGESSPTPMMTEEVRRRARWGSRLREERCAANER